MLAKAGDVYCVYNTHLKKIHSLPDNQDRRGGEKASGCPTVIRLVRRRTSYRRRTIFLKATVH